MRRVLHIGPCDTPGGMAKVMNILAENPQDGWKSEMISSHSGLGVFRKILLIRTEPMKLVTKGANLEKIRKLRISIFL